MARFRLLLLPFILLILHLRRACTWDVAAVPLTGGEETRLAARGIVQETPCRYLVWRRSLLLVIVLPLALNALLTTLDDGEELKFLSDLGWLVTGADLLADYLLPLAALTAALLWTRPRWSRRVLVGGWIVGFLVPLLTALVPLDWLLDLPDTGVPDIDRAVRKSIGVAAAVIYFVTLMPTILSLLPGMLRACVRVKSLLPGSVLAGWLLVAGAPFYALLLFVAFLALNQAAGSPLLLAGMGLILTAPLVYVIRATLFIRPLSGAADHRALAWVQRVFVACVLTGMGLLVVYLFRKKVAGRYLVGLDPQVSWSSVWDLARFAVAYVGRTLFITAVAADLLVRATLSAWRHERRFQDTEQADEHRRRMEELEAMTTRPKMGVGSSGGR